MVRDITQIYTQPKTKLKQIIIYHLLIKLNTRNHVVIILIVIKLLQGLVKTGNLQFATYLEDQKNKIRQEISSYDICFFVTKDSVENFGISGLQIVNIFNI